MSANSSRRHMLACHCVPHQATTPMPMSPWSSQLWPLWLGPFSAANQKAVQAALHNMTFVAPANSTNSTGSASLSDMQLAIGRSTFQFNRTSGKGKLGGGSPCRVGRVVLQHKPGLGSMALWVHASTTCEHATAAPFARAGALLRLSLPSDMILQGKGSNRTFPRFIAFRQLKAPPAGKPASNNWIGGVTIPDAFHGRTTAAPFLFSCSGASAEPCAQCSGIAYTRTRTDSAHPMHAPSHRVSHQHRPLLPSQL